MKILGIDISSSCTGWSVICDDKLVNFGKIETTGKLTEQQKLFLFSMELQKVINEVKPDEISIEDVIMVQSVSTAKLLSRFSAVPRIEAYRYMKRDVYLYEPPTWKKMLGLSGSAEKCEVQVEVCRRFNLLSTEKIDQYLLRISKIHNDFKRVNDSLSNESDILKKQLKNKKIEQSLKDSISKRLSEIKEETLKLKKSGKKIAKDALMAISQEIYTETGVNNDIADSIGVAIALQMDKSKK